MPNIKNLFLTDSSAKYDEHGPNIVGQLHSLSNLTDLTIQNTKLRELPTLPELQVLVLVGTGITDIRVLYRGIPNISHIILHRNQTLSGGVVLLTTLTPANTSLYLPLPIFLITS